ncbi:hypothetical protein [Nocardia sp. IFM 10818]
MAVAPTVVATDLRGKAVRGVHFLPEENPDVVARELLDFLAARPLL